MIWYRYWLEIRSRLLALAMIAVCIGSITPDWEKRGGFGNDLMLNSPLGHSLGTDKVLIWITFTNTISFFAWTAGLCLMGNGLSTAWQRHHSSVNYTLTLPVSRQRLIGIYQFGNCVAGLGVTFLALASYCVVLLLQGHEVPIVPLGFSLAFGSLFVIAWMTILSGLTLVMHEVWAVLASSVLFLISIPWVRSTVTLLPAYGEFPWISVAALVTISVLALAFSLSVSREQEFG